MGVVRCVWLLLRAKEPTRRVHEIAMELGAVRGSIGRVGM